MRPRHFPLFSLLLLVCVTGALGLPRSAAAKATLEIVNNDGPNEGFNDPTPTNPIGGNPGMTLGQQRLNAFQFAADQLANLLDSSIKIKIRASIDNLGDCVLNPDLTTISVVLGGAGANTLHRDFSGALLPNTWYPQALANALAEADLCAAATCADPSDDATAVFNSVLDNPGSLCGLLAGITWYYGLDAFSNPLTNQIDFVTIIFHELIHGLGFFSAVDLQTGEKFLGADDAYSHHLNDLSLGSWAGLDNAQRAASSVGGNLFWSGPEVSATNGGNKEMYAPPQLAEGSSVSHFDLTDLAPPNELLEPAYKSPSHNPGLADPLLQDLGWNMAQCTFTDTEESGVSCADDIDNDCDGFIDGADLDCPQLCVPAQTPEIDCTDGLDNDCNGAVDENDPNCQAVCEVGCSTPTEIPEVTCGDNIDNDCDGFVDFNDADCPACMSNELPNEVTCNDNIDNDCDGFVDFNDADCTTCIPTEIPEVSCTDGIDNNCFGGIDCVDPDCSGDAACSGGPPPPPICAEKGLACTINSDCCSNKCRGPVGSMMCR